MHVALHPLFIFTVIFAFPFFLAVTFPFLLTVATDFFEDVQFDILSPLDFLYIFNCMLFPAFTDTFFLIETDAFNFFIVLVSCFPQLLHFLVLVPFLNIVGFFEVFQLEYL